MSGILDQFVIAWMVLTQLVMLWKMVTDFRNPPRWRFLAPLLVLIFLWGRHL